MNSKKKYVKTCGLVALLVSALMFMACNLGLGEVVDIEIPTVSIMSPGGAEALNKTFEINGTWADDSGVSCINLRVEQILDRNNKEKVYETKIEITDVAKSGNWATKIDTTPYIDGKYEIFVTAIDSAGRQSKEISETYYFDNTAPVVLLSKPNSLSFASPASYGRNVKIRGTVVEDHEISKINVRVFATDTEGNKGEEIYLPKSEFTDFDPNSLAITIAQYYTSGNIPSETVTEYQLYQNFIALYGDNTAYNSKWNTEQKYLFEISATDGAGNISEKAYINDSLSSLIRVATGNSKIKLEGSDYKKIINGTYKNPENYSVEKSITEDELKTVKAILDGSFDQSSLASKSDYLADSKNLLCFSINSKSNPTYEVLNCSFEDGEWNEIQAESGKFNISVACGLDEAVIYPNSINIYITPCDSLGNALDDESVIVLSQDSIIKEGAGTSVKDITTPVSADKYTVAFNSLKDKSGNDVIFKAGKWYKITVSGQDADENELIPPTNAEGNEFTYGFKIYSNGSQTSVGFDDNGRYKKAASLVSENPNAYITFQDTAAQSISVSAYVAIQEGITTINKSDYTAENRVLNNHVIELTNGEGSYSLPLNFPVPEANKNYTIGIYIIAVNTDTASEKFFQFYADNVAPALSFKNRLKTAAANGYSVGLIDESDTLFVDSEDGYTYTISGSWSDINGSGTKTLSYSMDEGKHWIDFENEEAPQSDSLLNWSKTIAVTENGPYSLWFKAVDEVGNETNPVKFTNVYFDHGVPEISISGGDLVDGKVDKYYKTNPSFVLKATDSNEMADIVLNVKKNGVAVAAADFAANGLSVSKVISADKKTITETIKITGDGDWSINAKAKDILSRVTADAGSAVINTVVDKVAPEWKEEAGFVPKFGSKDWNSLSSEKIWFNSTSLKFTGYYTEKGSGIDTVEWYVQPAGTSAVSDRVSGEFSTSDKGDYESFSSTIDGLRVSNTANVLHVTPVDKAGNRGAEKVFNLYVDSESPVLSCDKSGTIYTNKSSNIELTGTLTDDASGFNSSSVKVTVGSVNAVVTIDTTSTGLSATNAKWKAVIAKADLDKLTAGTSTDVKAVVIDGAGNSSSSNVCKINIDTTAPVLKFKNKLLEAQSKSNVIGNIFESDSQFQFDSEKNKYTYTINGTWSDIGGSGTSKLFYSVNDGAFVECSTSEAPKTDIELNWSKELTVTEGTEYKIKLYAQDEAGNKSSTYTFTGAYFDYSVPEISMSAPATVKEYYKKGDTVPAIVIKATDTNKVSDITLTVLKNNVAVAAGDGYTVSSTGKNTKTMTSTITLTEEAVWSVSAVAKDERGRISLTTVNANTIIDKTAPVWVENTTDKIPTVGGKNWNAAGAVTNWYNSSSLKFTGFYKEDVSGIDHVNWYIQPAGTTEVADRVSGEFSTTDKGDYETFSSTLDGFVASNSANTVYMTPVDKAGNSGVTKTFNIYIDSESPSLESDKSGTQLTNKVQAIAITGSASDDASGINTVVLKVNNKTVNATVTPVSAGDYTNVKWSASVSSSILGTLSDGNTYGVSAVVSDKAGNTSSSTIVKIAIDTTAPVAEISAPANVSALNGIKTISGSVTEVNEPVSFALYYYATTSASAVPGTTIANDIPAGWTQIGSTITSASQIYNWSFEDFDFTTKSNAASGVNGVGYIYLLPVVKDSAGNCNIYKTDGTSLISSKYKKYTVDLNTNRPTVKITNLTGNDTTLMYGDNSSITGVVSDDDSSATAVVKNIVVSSTPISSLTNVTTSTATGAAVSFNVLKNGAASTLKLSITSGFKYSTVKQGSYYDVTVYDPVSGDWTFYPYDVSDGQKEMNFYIEDNNSAKFYTGNTSKLYQPYVQYKAGEKSDNSAKINYISDSASPSITTAKGLAYKSLTAKSADALEEPLTASYIIGGSSKGYVQFTFKATDTNGIAGITMELSGTKTVSAGGSSTSTTVSLGKFATSSSYAGYTNKGTFVPTSDSTEAVWTTHVIDLTSATLNGKVDSGSITVSVVPYDQSGLTGNGTYTFILDNDGPSIKVSSPSRTTENNGTVNISGYTTDSLSKPAVVKWMIPTKTDAAKTDDALMSAGTWYEYGLAGTSSASFWDFAFDGSYTTPSNHFRDYCSSTYYTAFNSGIYEIPVYILAADELGNKSITRYGIKYNPDADMPQTSFAYPTSSDYDKDSSGVALSYVTLGGAIRVTGNVYIPAGLDTSAVYLQIKKKSDASWAASSYKSTYPGTLTTEAGIKAATGLSTLSNCPSDLWLIPVTLKASSWNITLNTNAELDPTGAGTNDIQIRACAVNAQGKFGAWSEPVDIHVDNTAPRYTQKLYKLNDSPATLAQLETAIAKWTAGTSSASDPYYVLADRNYDSGTYLRGQWYIATTINDETTVNVKSVKLGSSVLTENTDYFVSNISSYKDGAETRYQRNVYTKLTTTAYSTVTYMITAYDMESESSSGVHFIYPSYELNIDNQAPDIADLVNGNGTALEMTKLKNSQYVVTLGGSINDTGSGFDKLAFYFYRPNGATLELPIPGGNSTSGWTSAGKTAYKVARTSLAQDIDSGKATGLYGVTLSGTTSKNADGISTTFTISSGKTDFIRAGGLIKIAGNYYVISSVNGNSVTFDAVLGSTPSSAYFPAAMVVNNTAGESPSNSGGVFTIGRDDGDGMAESVTKSGTKWTWDASIFSDELEDGPITIVCVAFDVAGNYASKETHVMIANNTPRLAKVYLASDLNGNGKFSDNELGSSVLNSSSGGNVTQNFYSALSGSTWNSDSSSLEGSAQAISTILANSKNPENGTGLTVRDKVGVAFEFVSGSSQTGGFGTGNNAIKYQISVGNSALTAPVSGTKGTLAAVTNTLWDNTTASTTGTLISGGNKGLTIATSELGTAGVNYTEWKNNDDSTHVLTNIGITLWDSTKGTTAGIGDTVVNGKITEFGSQYTVVNIPVYIDLVDDQFPVPTINDPNETENNNGHVELGSKLPADNFKGSGEFDKDTKISGTVEFTGTVTDETRVSRIYLTTSSAFNKTAVNSTVLATYTAGSFTVNNSLPTGLKFEIINNEFSIETGHKVSYKLTVDSSYVGTTAAIKHAANDIIFTISASDGTNTNGAATVVPYAQKKVDIVPYITKVERVNNSGAAYYGTYGNDLLRSSYGRYAAIEGETLTMYGYNFDSAMTCNSGSTAPALSGITTNAAPYTTTENKANFVVPAVSGELSITVNGMKSLNNLNDDSLESNIESDENSHITDTRYLSVWNIGNYFANIDSKLAEEPVMAADKFGNLYASWGYIDNDNIMFSYGLNNVTTPIYRCYDQPAAYTGIGVDKYADNPDVSVLFMGEHQGNGARFSLTAMSNTVNGGGAGVINIPDAKNTVYDLTNKGTMVQMANNPRFNMDGTNYTAYYSLQSYDMTRAMGKFINPKAARYGDYMHNIWYDKKNGSLKYSVVKENDTRFDANITTFAADGKGETGVAGVVAGWVVIDGGYTGQDRYYFPGNNSTYANSVISNNKQAHTITGTGSTYKASYDDVVFMSEGVPSSNEGNSQTTYFTPAGDKKSVTLKTLNTGHTITTGDTIALLQNNKGAYKIALRQITYDASTKKASWLTAAPYEIDTAVIYGGDLNVIGGSIAALDDDGTNFNTTAGIYADIDVTKEGIPVIAYYKEGGLYVVAAKNKAGTDSSYYTNKATNWNNPVKVADCMQDDISMRVDGNGKVHIMYTNAYGSLSYICVNTDGSTVTEAKIIESNKSGVYGTLSIKEKFTGTTVTGYIPCVTYLNSAGLRDCIKYAEFRDGDWDYQIVPTAGAGRYAIAKNKVCIEARKSTWAENASGASKFVTGVNAGTATVTPANVDAAISFLSNKHYEATYLKSE